MGLGGQAAELSFLAVLTAVTQEQVRDTAPLPRHPSPSAPHPLPGHFRSRWVATGSRETGQGPLWAGFAWLEKCNGAVGGQVGSSIQEQDGWVGLRFQGGVRAGMGLGQSHDPLLLAPVMGASSTGSSCDQSLSTELVPTTGTRREQIAVLPADQGK